MTDVYRAPDFNFSQEGEKPSTLLQRAIAGEYSFAVFETFDEVWRQIKGKKGALWLGWLAVMAVSIGITLVFVMLESLLGHSGGYGAIFRSASFGGKAAAAVLEVAKNVAQTLVTLPVQLGFFMFMLKRLAGLPTELEELFQHFGKMASLFLTTLLMYLLIGIGLLCLVLPGIYLLVAYMFANDLVVEKGLGPWQALEASRKAVTHHWWGFLGFNIVNFLIAAAAMLPLFIGIIISIHQNWGDIAIRVMGGGLMSLVALVWVLPATTLAKPLLYRKVFGCEAELPPEAHAEASMA